MHPWPLQAKHQNVLSKQIASDGDAAKTSAFNWIMAAENAIIKCKSKTKVELWLGFLRDVYGWQGWFGVGRSWSGCGYGPAALSLALGCSRRQGHMPEGELASLLPAQPGAFLKPLLYVFPFFFFCSWFCLYYSKSLSSVNVLLITLSFSRLSLFVHLFPLLICSLFSQILKSLNSPHLLPSIVFPLYISE